ncbi:MAG TPA: hypothetical protein VMD78_04035 [Candidatus Baltobacteraceae bacterium]|nr:hypothetical protein [Candidatus Baltobacteraceae bacterium]
MNVSTPLAIALLGAAATVLGYFVSNSLERRRTLALREMEFRLDRYKEFLLAFSEFSVRRTFEAQLRFVDSVNVILLIGSNDLLRAVKDLVDNYNDGEGTAQKQETILDHIVLGMRRDLNCSDTEDLAGFSFPVIVPDIAPNDDGRGQEAQR